MREAVPTRSLCSRSRAASCSGSSSSSEQGSGSSRVRVRVKVRVNPKVGVTLRFGLTSVRHPSVRPSTVRPSSVRSVRRPSTVRPSTVEDQVCSRSTKSDVFVIDPISVSFRSYGVILVPLEPESNARRSGHRICSGLKTLRHRVELQVIH